MPRVGQVSETPEQRLERVKRMSPLDRFLYWIKERHAVYLKKTTGLPKPWTPDPILRDFYFTNPYRENDKVTVWFRDNIRQPLRDDRRVALATTIFRWFNLPSTAEVLGMELLTNWDSSEAFVRLDKVRRAGGQVFTGAYMINSPAGRPKLEAVLERIDGVWADRKALVSKLESASTLRAAHEALTKYDGLGGFMAYEIVCDLRYTYLLEDASDINSWSNPGPGAIRGLYRILGRPFDKGNNSTSPPRPLDWEDRTAELLALVNSSLPAGMRRFEMREVEHSLCEADKYVRALEGDGKMKRRYKGA